MNRRSKAKSKLKSVRGATWLSSVSSRSFFVLFVVVVLLGVLPHPTNGAPSSNKLPSSSSSLFSSTPCIYIGCICRNELIRCSSNSQASGENMSSQRINLFPKRYTTFEPYPFNITLKLNDNELELIPDDRLANLEVESADFSNNRIFRVSPDAFRDVRRLARLDLTKNFLTSIYMATFKPIELTLISLKLGNNHLYQMETTRLANALTVAQRLESLNLDNNRLHSFPNLARLTRLRYLTLDNNYIETLIDFDTGEELLPKSLLELSMRNNRLKYINANFFGHLVRLRHLNLASNQISTFGENSFVRLRNLTTLILSRNHLKHIPSKIFYTLVSLEVLDLSSQQQSIKKLDDFAFDRLSGANPIRKIDLSNNGIEAIDNKAFCSRNRTNPYINVKEIDIANNQLTTINSCILKQLYRGFQENLNNELNQVKQSKSRSGLPKYYRSRPFIKTGFVNRSSSVEDEALIQRSLRCDCEVTRAAKIADLEGNCLLVNPDGAIEYVYQLRDYQCPAYMVIRTSNDVSKYCMNQTEYDCTSFSTSAIFGIEPNDFYNSHLIEISDEDPYTTTTTVATTVIFALDFNETYSLNGTNSTDEFGLNATTPTKFSPSYSNGDYESSSEYSDTKDPREDGGSNQNGNYRNDFDKTKKSSDTESSTTSPPTTSNSASKNKSLASFIPLVYLMIQMILGN